MTQSAMRDTPDAQNAEAETTANGQQLRDVLLVALTVASGAVDAVSYFGLGKIFSAFMTGNIVFLGFGIAEIEGPDVVPVIFALSAFAAGGYLGARLVTMRSQESGLWPRRVSVLLALVAMAEAIFLAVWLTMAGHPKPEITDVLIVLFSLAMGIQTAAVRSLGVQGVFTTAGTFTLIAFAGAFAGTRPRAETPRLLGVLLGLVAGAIGGGLLFLHARSYAPLLPLAITILVILAGRTLLRSPRHAAPARGSDKCHRRTLFVASGFGVAGLLRRKLISIAYRPVGNGSRTPRRAKRNVECEGTQPLSPLGEP